MIKVIDHLLLRFLVCADSSCAKYCELCRGWSWKCDRTSSAKCSVPAEAFPCLLPCLSAVSQNLPPWFPHGLLPLQTCVQQVFFLSGTGNVLCTITSVIHMTRLMLNKGNKWSSEKVGYGLLYIYPFMGVETGEKAWEIHYYPFFWVPFIILTQIF